MHLNLGFNIARFFSKKFILGVSTDFKIFPGYTKQYFSNQFIQDFNSNYIQIYDNELDSARAEVLYKTVNKIDNYRIKGNIILDFGFSFSPFPQK